MNCFLLLRCERREKINNSDDLLQLYPGSLSIHIRDGRPRPVGNSVRLGWSSVTVNDARPRVVNQTLYQLYRLHQTLEEIGGLLAE